MYGLQPLSNGELLGPRDLTTYISQSLWKEFIWNIIRFITIKWSGKLDFLINKKMVHKRHHLETRILGLSWTHTKENYLPYSL